MKWLLNSSRYEIKYFIPDDMIPKVRKYAEDNMQWDPYSSCIDDKRYTVRSIYYDTPDLDFYYEKMDGLKVRKKLRVRAYNQQKEYAFLEIKRRYVNCIIKERTKLSFPRVEEILNIHNNGKTAISYEPEDHQTRLVYGKFKYNLTKGDLEPSLLVVYEREALIGRVDQNQRLTIDTDVRTRIFPLFKDLFDGHNLTYVTQNVGILEMKFNDLMPKWMRVMVGEFGIRPQSISKYCMGIDRCRIEQ